MTYEQANSVKHLAPEVYEVLKRLDVECPECKGKKQRHTTRRVYGFRGTAGQALHEEERVIDCLKCNGIGKVKWKWQSKVGEFFLNNALDNLPHLVADDNCIRDIMNTSGYDENEFIPILEWEEVEKVLEKAGLGLIWYCEKFGLELYWSDEGNPNQDPCVIVEKAKSRLLAVYKAVIALGKEKINANN